MAEARDKKIVIVGEVSPEQLDSWKTKHKEVYTIEVVDDDCIRTGYLRKPDIKALSEVSRKAVVITPEGDIQQNIVEAGIHMIDTCWLGGDEQIRTDDDLLYAAAQVAQTMYKAKLARLKKN